LLSDGRKQGHANRGVEIEAGTVDEPIEQKRSALQ
jgi:hypothetical protein